MRVLAQVVRRLAAPVVFVAMMTVLACSAQGDLLPPQIHTVAGGGGCTTINIVALANVTVPCDGVAPTKDPVGAPRSVAALPGGGYLYVDPTYDLVREVTPAGMVMTVAGNGTIDDAPDGTLAVSSGLNGPVAVAPLPGGGFLVTEYAGSVVRMVSSLDPTTATITTIAGVLSANGTSGAGNNGTAGPATSIRLMYPTDAQPTADGRVLIADAHNGYVRLVSAAAPGATLSTIAGAGPVSCDDAASACDGAAAGTVQLHSPDSIFPLDGGVAGYLLAEYDTGTVREVSSLDPSGTFTTVAGTPGQMGFSGDGGLATSAQLFHPEQVVGLPDGSFLIADTDNERVREVTPSGTIATVAGNGVVSYAGDGGDATAASLHSPVSISPTGGGGFLIADQDNQVIRAVTIAPVTTISLSPSFPNGGGGYFNTAVKAKVSTTGKSIHCVLDPVEPPPAYGAMPSCPYGGSGMSISGDGEHTLYAASVNSYGDQENPISISFKMDTTSPVVTCASAAPPVFDFGAPGAQLAASATDAGGSGPRTPLILTPVNDHILGKHWIIATAYDVAGNPGGQVCYYNVLPLKFSPAPVLQWKFAPGRASSKVATLAVTHVAKGATVGVVCHGKGCPFASKRSVRGHTCHGSHCQGAGTTVDLRALFGRHRLPVSTGLTVTVTAKGTIGQAFLLGVRSGRQPSYRTACLAPGATTKPGHRC